ncbi:MAG: hypothetical protein ABI760_17395 [Ferruginibacter sp.]
MILAINGGSSGIKFALFKTGKPPEEVLSGEVENIGTKKAKLNLYNTATQQKECLDIEAVNHDQAAKSFD